MKKKSARNAIDTILHTTSGRGTAVMTVRAKPGDQVEVVLSWANATALTATASTVQEAMDALNLALQP